MTSQLSKQELKTLFDALDTARQCYMTDLRRAAKNEDSVAAQDASQEIKELQEVEKKVWSILK